MNYLEQDIIFYTTVNPHLRYLNMRERPLLAYLKETTEMMVDYQDVLKNEQEYEPLEGVYILNRQLKTFTPRICSDMIKISQQSAVIAAFLAMLSKKQEYLLYINNAIVKYPDSRFIFELANNFIIDKVSDNYKPYFNYVEIIRKNLDGMPNDIIQLRVIPSNPTDLAAFYDQLKNQQEDFKNYYHNHSIEESLAYIKQLPLFSYIVDYKTWYKSYRQ